MMRLNVFRMGTILQVFSKGNGVQSFPIGFVHAYGRPYESIRKNGVHVKITFQSFITGYIRYFNFMADLCGGWQV